MASWEEPIETGEVPESGSAFDAIVVGGGPGGCSAAGYLAMADKKGPYRKRRLASGQNMR